MSAAGLFDSHMPAALAVAREFFLPGADRADVEQEARLGLWQAATTYDGQGAFTGWATFVVRRRLISAVRSAKAEKHRPLTESMRTTLLQSVEVEGGVEEVPILDTLAGGRDPLDLVIARDEWERLCAAVRELTPLERRSIERLLQGDVQRQDKQLDNTVTRARRKLREAIA